ncbi:phosphotransferase [Paenibacillus sp. JCM 10914]|uniref:phosphotransferase enzyme family protein n=1 Tax=Paenibacillus sp. JCM 10914 TaxID=1236974 RepID=UPI0003CCA58B|nr:phosphotransferase [Paenibacillus sp. JCM 10914]GAE08915.1 hypothetical protein JCM10914_5252 [Paenibacillus sp. JCM 10914]
MYQEERRILDTAYSFHEPFEITILHQGENATFLVEKDSSSFILRKYRLGRYNEAQIMAEITWLEALGCYLNVPHPLKNQDQLYLTIFPTPTGTQYYALFNYIVGESVDSPSFQDYHNLGRTLALLHEKSDIILQTSTKDWIGYNRPRYDQNIIEASLHCLLEAPFLDRKDKQQCQSLSDSLIEAYSKYMLTDELHFLHGDAHSGNILRSNGLLHLLDFDECGFGHRAFDMGVPRLHMISAGNVEQLWGSFMNGYQQKVTEDEIRTGTAMRIFYMAGKIPQRLDIEHLRHQPEQYIKKYLLYLKKELSGDTAI